MELKVTKVRPASRARPGLRARKGRLEPQDRLALRVTKVRPASRACKVRRVTKATKDSRDIKAQQGIKVSKVPQGRPALKARLDPSGLRVRRALPAPRVYRDRRVCSATFWRTMFI